jgi:hypothetical protein
MICDPTRGLRPDRSHAGAWCFSEVVFLPA